MIIMRFLFSYGYNLFILPKTLVEKMTMPKHDPERALGRDPPQHAALLHTPMFQTDWILGGLFNCLSIFVPFLSVNAERSESVLNLNFETKRRLDNSFKIPSRNEADARVWNGGGGGQGAGRSEHSSLDRRLWLLFATPHCNRFRMWRALDAHRERRIHFRKEIERPKLGQ